MLNFLLMDIFHQVKMMVETLLSLKINLKSHIQLTKKIRVYNLGEISKLQGKEFYKAKIGFEISL